MNNKTRYLILYYSILFVVGLIAACLGPAIPVLAANTLSGLSEVSLVFSVRPAGYLLGSLLAGRLLDRLPGHLVLIGAMALASLSLMLTPHMSSLIALALLILFLGLADGALDVGTNTLLPWVYGEKAGPYFNGMHFMFGLGALSAPLIIERSLRLASGMQGGFSLMALSCLPILIALYLLPSPRRQEAASKAQAAPLTLSKPLLLVIALIFFSYGGSEAAFGNWIFSYAKARNLADASSAAWLTSLFWGSLTLGRLIAIPLGLSLRGALVLTADAILAITGLGALLLWPESKSVLWVATAATGLGLASFFPTLVAWCGRKLSPDGRLSGGVTSLFFVGSAAGSITLPWIIGRGFESIGPGMAPGVIFSALLGMGALLLILLKAP